MTRKEEILRATLDLAAEQGLQSVTLSQIAGRVGMRKPSLYNHFASKDEIVEEAYRFLRKQSQERNGASVVDYAATFEGRTLEEILLGFFDQYRSFVLDEDLMRFWRVLYAERSHNPVAAQIMVDETEHMVRQVKALFYALVAHELMQCDDVDMAALSFAMTVHALVDYQLDKLGAQGAWPSDDPSAFREVRDYIAWFARKAVSDHA